MLHTSLTNNLTVVADHAAAHHMRV